MRDVPGGLRVVLLIGLVLAPGCGGGSEGGEGGGDADGGGGGGGGGGDDAPTCETGEVALEGTLAGVTVAESMTSNGQLFMNAFSGGTGTLEVYGTYPNIVVHLEFTELIANGGSGDARGWVDFTSEGSDVAAGNCDTGDFVSELAIDSDGEGYTFTLEELHAPPYCTGAAMTGTLRGCFRQPPVGP